MTTKEAHLIKKYSEIFSLTENQPEWAVRKVSNSNELVHPSIPFIGKLYDDLRILLLASSENLTYYTKKEKYLDDDSIAINRHRYCFENKSKDKFFPFMHIEPVTNGALVLITAYVINKLKGKEFSNPYDLIESIATGNFGKFSKIDKRKNIDYAHKSNSLDSSVKYIEADLKTLKPEIIILPKSIYSKKYVEKMIRDILPNTIVLPIYQITPTTVNVHIHRKYKRKNKSKLPEWIVEWHNKLSTSGRIKGKTQDNFYSVYTYLDEILKKVK